MALPKKKKIIIIASATGAVLLLLIIVILKIVLNPGIELVYTGKTYAHNTESFTQGLFFDEDGKLYETGGNYGESAIYADIDLNSGLAAKKAKVDSSVFLEGSTTLNDRLYMLTWRENIAYRYNKDLKLEKKYTLDHEGWGLTTDGYELIASDGTSTIRFYDDAFNLLRSIKVRDENDDLVLNINELEYIKGYIFANVWLTDKIIVINPENGKVVRTYEFTDLYPKGKRRDEYDVLNGIAYNKNTNKVYLTGKHWPYYFEFDLK